MKESLPSSVAVAYATRVEVEMGRQNKLYRELAGLNTLPPARPNQRVIMLRAQKVDSIFESRDDQSLLEVERAYLCKSCTQYLVSETEEQPFGRFIDKQILSRLARKLSQELVEQGYPDDSLRRLITLDTSRIEAAKEIAEEEDLIPEIVFQNGNLYEEGVRRAITPSEYVDACLPWREAVISDRWLNIQQNLFTDLLRAHPVLRVQSAPGARGMGKGFPLPVVMNRLIESQRLPLETRKRASSKLILCEVERFWGHEGLDSLAPEQRQALQLG